MRIAVGAMAGAMMTLLLASAAHACGGSQPCWLDERSYRAELPPGWDGKTPLPVLLHFHGWGRTATNVVRNERIVGATRSNNVLLLAPNGLGKSWSFWSNDDQDINFAEAVLKDAKSRWPIDRERVFISGFSYGSAMAWNLACDSGDRYAAILGIAGTLWNINRKRCSTGPITLRHVHGLKDGVMRLPIGKGDDPTISMKRWRETSRCGSSVASEKIGRYTRYRWPSCANQRNVQIDVHTGGHWIPKGWLAAQLKDLLAE